MTKSRQHPPDIRFCRGRGLEREQRESGEFPDLGGQLSAGIAGVDDPARLEKEYRSLDVGSGAVLGAAGHDKELAWREHDAAVSHLDGELSVEDQEELVGVGVPVPGELALDLHDPDIVVVDLGNLLRRPVLSEARQHRVQVYRFHVPIVTRKSGQPAPLCPDRTSGHAAMMAVLGVRDLAARIVPAWSLPCSADLPRIRQISLRGRSRLPRMPTTGLLHAYSSQTGTPYRCRSLRHKTAECSGA